MFLLEALEYRSICVCVRICVYACVYMCTCMCVDAYMCVCISGMYVNTVYMIEAMRRW